MALPRRRDAEADQPRRNAGGHFPTGPQISARTVTAAEAQARYRAGHRSRRPRGAADPVWAERRNGLPEFRPYVYRGTGGDLFTGEVA